jgi:hypothetical protein
VTRPAAYLTTHSRRGATAGGGGESTVTYNNSWELGQLSQQQLEKACGAAEA